MRLSADEYDPGYSPLSVFAHVYLDGARLLDCFTADEERGEALCYARDAAGCLIVAEGELVTERRTGSVRIVLEAPAGHG